MFHSKDPSSRFLEFFQAIIVVAHGNIPRSMALVLGANTVLTMAKDIGSFCPIAIGEAFF